MSEESFQSGEALHDRRAALAAEWAEWAREEARGEQTVAEMSAGIERMNALLIRSRDAGLSYGEIAEMQSRALTEAKGEDVPITRQDVIAWMRDHVDEEHEVEFRGSAIWGGATLGLLAGLILGFFVGSSYWSTVLIAVLIGAGAGIAANMLAWVGNVIARRGKAER